MKKKAISFLAAGVLLTGSILPGTAWADGNHNKQYKHEDKHKEKHRHGLENALKHVKNPEVREKLERMLEQKLKEWERENVKTDVQRVAADKAALQIDFGGSDTAGSITQPFDALPSKGKLGSTITWTSSNPSIISNDGKTVNRPAFGSGDVKVKMTATLSYGSAKDTKVFELTVKQQWTDAQKVAADKAALAITFSGSDTASSVTGPLTLPAKGASGSKIVWVSSNTSIISNDGKTVNRPSTGTGDAVVVLTALISSGTVTDYKTFTLTVKQQFTDAQKVAADKAALGITYSGSDTASSVTRPLTLPATGPNGSRIVWVSSNTSIISNDGKTVNRPSTGTGDAVVVLTALITSGTVSDYKTFTITVKQQLTDAQKVAADKAALTIKFSGSDTAASVTGPLTLPTIGVNGSTIVWISSNTALISHDGKTVVRPAAGSGDAVVTLTAFLYSGGITDTKNFTVIVKQRTQ